MVPVQERPGRLALLDWLKGDDGLAGRVALSWTLAGGLSMQALVLVAAYLSGADSAAAIAFSGSIFFVIGAVGGFVHGCIVGAAGRPPGVEMPRAARSLEAAAMWAVPALIVAWIASIWMSMTPVALRLHQPMMLATAALGWGVCAAACCWAVDEACCGLRYAMNRWPERRPGIPLVLTAFVLLLGSFLYYRPYIWFTELRVTAVGAGLLALGATMWIVLPVLVALLHILHEVRADSPIWEDWKDDA